MSRHIPRDDRAAGQALAEYALILSLIVIFSILALVLDRDSIRIAFKALHREDERLRGTALEYLETVLPDEIRDAVWPFLGEARPLRSPRPAAEILADLLGAREAAEPERRKG